MKKLVFAIPLCLCMLGAFAQSSFQGRILYQNKFLLPNGQDITESASKIMGAQQDYYINANNYKSTSNGQQVGYFGEVDHLIPWQIDHLNVWRPVAE
ncbi:hypothetical protein ACWKW6_34190, partial [Dyadobacter jiangsuensis]